MFAHGGGGGAEAHALDLAKKSIQKGDKVLFLIGDESTLEKNLKKDSIDYAILDLSSSFNPFIVLRAALAIKQLIQNNKIDIIHTHMLREQSLVILAKIMGAEVKLIRTFHRLDQFNWKMLPLIWFYNKRTDAVIAITDYIKSYLIKNHINPDLVTTIYNGVEEVNIKKPGDKIGYIGRVSPEKGIRRLIITNLDELKEKEIIVAGDGSDLESLKSFVEEKKVRVEFMGRVYDRKKFFSKVGVLVLPSESEVLPLVVLEAFSAKIPVVTFDLPSLKGIVPENQTVKKGDYEGLLKRAEELLRDGKTIGLANYVIYKEKYTVGNMFEKTNDLYLKLFKNTGS
jgi:glycosyltransferase involved in cell wall biosynthesis